jgi:RNA polymerase sigma-70 factor (ECF subfamily)
MATPDPSPQQFHPTRWSLVLQARGEGEAARRALADLCQTYWFPLYAWCRRSGLASADAEDMVQGFFLRVLEKRLFDSADAARGKLRTFLLTALQRHVKDERNKAQAQRRGGGKVVSFDAVEAEQWYKADRVEGENPDHYFDRQWAITVLDHAMERLERQSAGRGKSGAFAAMRPFLTNEGSVAEYEDAGRPLGMNGGAFKVAVHRLRLKFRDALRSEVAETQPEESSVDEEIAYLMRVLAGQ